MSELCFLALNHILDIVAKCDKSLSTSVGFLIGGYYSFSFLPLGDDLAEITLKVLSDILLKMINEKSCELLKVLMSDNIDSLGFGIKNLRLG